MAWCFFAALTLSPLAAQAVQSTGAARTPTRATLQNGLDIYVLELPEAASLRMGFIFRTGASAQTKDTAGLFRLLELLLFRGDASNPGLPEPGDSLIALDAAELAGGTSVDRMDFWFDIDPARTAQGLDTMASLFSGPVLDMALADPSALESARAAAQQSLKDTMANPVAVYEAGIAKKLFSKAPWRLDPAGSPAALGAVKADRLRALAAAWCVPNNALLVVAGNVKAPDIIAKAHTAFGSWAKAANPWAPAPASFPKPGVTRPVFMVQTDDSIPQGSAHFELRYRGPDTSDPAQAASALFWAELASSPSAKLTQAVKKLLPKNSQPSDPYACYHASRDASYITLSLSFKLEGSSNLASRILSLKETVRNTEMYMMKANASYFPKDAYEEARAALLASIDGSAADPARAAACIADAWVEGGPQWLETLNDRIAAIGSKDIIAFVDTYFMKNLEVVTVRLNSADYAAQKKGLDTYGFEQITPSKAFWWQ